VLRHQSLPACRLHGIGTVDVANESSAENGKSLCHSTPVKESGALSMDFLADMVTCLRANHINPQRPRRSDLVPQPFVFCGKLLGCLCANPLLKFCSRVCPRLSLIWIARSSLCAAF